MMEDDTHWDALETGSILRRRSRIAARRLAAAQLGARQQARMMLAGMKREPEAFSEDDIACGEALVAEYDAIIREQEAIDLEKATLEAHYAGLRAGTASISCACGTTTVLESRTKEAAETEAEQLGWRTDGATWRYPPCMNRSLCVCGHAYTDHWADDAGSLEDPCDADCGCADFTPAPDDAPPEDHRRTTGGGEE